MFSKLFKVQFLSLFSGLFKGNKKEKISKGKLLGVMAVILFLMCYLVFFMLMIFNGLAILLKGENEQWLYFVIATFLAVVVSILTTLFSTKSTLYNAKDNKLLISMPIKSSDILFVRVITLYLFIFIVQAIVLLPAGIVYFVKIACNSQMVVSYIILLILLPLLSLFINCVLGWLFTWFSAKVRYANAIGVFGGMCLLAGYIVLCFYIKDIVVAVLASTDKLTHICQTYFYSFYQFGLAMSGASWTSLLISTAILIIPMVLTYWVLSKTFIKLATSPLKQNRIEYKEKPLKSTTQLLALIKKDFSNFISKPAYIINSSIGVIVTFIFFLFATLQLDTVIRHYSEVLNYDLSKYLPYVLIALICWFSGLNFVSAPSISLEAKNIWLLQVVPIDSKNVIMAKAYTHMIVCMPVNILSAIVLSIVMRFTFVEFLLLLFVPCMYVALTGLFGVIVNLWLPKFDWLNETVAIKQSASVGVSMIANLLFLLIFIVLAVVLINYIPIQVFTIMFFLIMLVLYYGLYIFVCRKGRQLFSKLKN